MDVKQAIAASMAQAEVVVDGYLADITPAEMLARAVPGTNHLAWQLGHLIAAEHYLAGKCLPPGTLPPLPAGFAERHKKETAGSDRPEDFLSKDEYQQVRRQLRGQINEAIGRLAPADFDQPVTGMPPFVHTVGEGLIFLAGHWVMHAGQWAVIRRKLGRAPLF